MRIDTPTLVVGALTLLPLCFAAASGAGSEGKESGAEPAPDVSGARPPVNRLLGIKAPGKISAVSWSVSRNETYFSAIQIIFPTVRQGEKQPEHPRTQVWLLKADGTVIPPSQKPSVTGIDNAGGTTESALYTYSHSAAAEAIAVVVSIDGQLFVEPLSQDAE